MKSTAFTLIEERLASWMRAANTPGAAVAWLERGRAPGFICAGVQDLDSRAAITAQTVFEAASLSKPIFACAALQLAGEGALDLDAPIQRYLPEALIPGEERLALLTPRRILSHSSGLPNWFRAEGPRELLFSPGERFGYSGEGYLTLQRVVETICGLDLEAFIRQRVFDPLGMRQSSFLRRGDENRLITQGHDEKGAPLAVNDRVGLNAGSSLHTSLADYTAFLTQVLSQSDWLPPAWRGALLSVQTPIDDRTAWGLGWGLKRIGTDWVFWQWGDNSGYKHLAAGSLAEGKAVCVLTNGERGYEVWKNVLRAAFDPRDEVFRWLASI